MLYTLGAYAARLCIYADAGELPGFLYDKSPEEFFKYMSLIVPYKGQSFEDVSRKPLDIIRFGGDCGEKTKCCMIYFNQHGINYDLVFLTDNNIYHVFPTAVLNGAYVDFDTAYGNLKMGERYNLPVVERVAIRGAGSR
jgi:hypothetical protein